MELVISVSRSVIVALCTELDITVPVTTGFPDGSVYVPEPSRDIINTPMVHHYKIPVLLACNIFLQLDMVDHYKIPLLLGCTVFVLLDLLL